ncbi:MAG: hypoxanthine phosphoribosyltransferase [Aquificaceae bacterium]|nr:hypoxanthine phosphoribosyltransferase [Aquificaceae bacterium]MDW8236958.1 hypoxanthine phosphoribosyltransferase [Aquificaceae bacterium]
MKLAGKRLKELFSQSQIQNRLDEIAPKIESAIGEKFVVIGVLKGAFIITADLVRRFKLPILIDFIWISSYGLKSSPGDVKLICDISLNIENQKVLIVEDILDTGQSLEWLSSHLEKKGAKEIFTFALLKKSRRQARIEINFHGFEIGDEFVVGYGMDLAEEGRELPGVYALEL